MLILVISFLTVFIIGLLTGSFLNVVIYRLPRRESIVYPGSHCCACGHRLSASDLVPVLSYMRLRGKCRYCGAKIAWLYPLAEILTAVAFLTVYLQKGLSLLTVSGWVLTAVLVVASFTDLDQGIIPDRLTYPAAAAGLVLSFFTIGFKTSLAGMAFLALLFILTAVVSRGGMGGGDIKLAVVIGAFTGWPGALLVFMLSSVMGGLWAVYLLAQKKAGRKTAVRFGPFLSLAAFLTWTWGEQIINLYLRLWPV